MHARGPAFMIVPPDVRYACKPRLPTSQLHLIPNGRAVHAPQPLTSSRASACARQSSCPQAKRTNTGSAQHVMTEKQLSVRCQERTAYKFSARRIAIIWR